MRYLSSSPAVAARSPTMMLMARMNLLSVKFILRHMRSRSNMVYLFVVCLVVFVGFIYV